MEQGTGQQASARMGRPPLTERRKAATRLEIAQEAVRLFAAKGVAATSAEEIAQAVGISQRTLWRYFASKEQCVEPLLASGVGVLAERLREWRPGTPLFTVGAGAGRLLTVTPEQAEALRGLIRLTRDEDGLRAVWLQVHQQAEPVFAEAVAEGTGRGAGDLEPRVQAAMINTALRVAVEEWAWNSADGSAAGLHAVLERALRVAAAGLPG
ncbi:TetR/AcrR family transcriptional regulator [Streptacidiphilus carbonis]|uniref:TetR/AcrR family transcriptional regulator n=1 Tax=Streptacidiphilus carbonis TaxID=105422 RepID=UPI0005A79278|nr:TetR/AcrR family transcriptional regulator [Streptacidiphilus carbonis]